MDNAVPKVVDERAVPIADGSAFICQIDQSEEVRTCSVNFGK